MKHPQNLFLLLLIVVVALAGCVRKVTYKDGVLPPERALTQIDAPGLDFNDDLDIASLVLAIDRSLAYYNGAGRNQMFLIGDRLVGASQMKETLIAFRGILQSNISVEQLKKQIAEDFLVLRALGANSDGSIVFTGYYEPLLEGSLI